MQKKVFIAFIIAVLTYGVLHSAELLHSDESQARRIKISALGDSSFMKISDHMYRNSHDPVLWAGEASFISNSHIDIPASSRVIECLKRVSLYKLANQGGTYIGTAYINMIDWTRLVSIIHINYVDDNRLQLTFSDGSERSIALKDCRV
jgi:hypothetical protein